MVYIEVVMTHAETLEEFPHYFRHTTENDIHIFDWCVKHFGDLPSDKWCTSFRGYYIKDEKDYVLAMLRWS